MRTSTMFVTKDHFIFVIKSMEITTELYAAMDYPDGNPIGFLSKGNAIPFFGTKAETEIAWEKYSEEQTAPNFHIRSKNSLFGAVASSDEVEYFTIIPREGVLLDGEWKRISNVNEEEENTINSSGTEFQIGESCEIMIYRNLDTFEQIDIPYLDTDFDESVEFTFE